MQPGGREEDEEDELRPVVEASVVLMGLHVCASGYRRRTFSEVTGVEGKEL